MATGTYSTKITTATPGANNSAVSALQTATNAANKGVAGYTPIAVDGKYGPQTAAAVAFKAPATTTPAGGTPTTTPTGGDTPAPSGVNRIIYGEEPEISQAETQDQAQAAALARNQGAIDSLNQYYDQLRQDSIVTGEKNMRNTDLGSLSSGLMGSTAANAASEKTSNTSEADLKRINLERNVQLQEIYTRIQNSAIEEAKQSRLEARQSGLDNTAWVEKAKKDTEEAITDYAKSGVTFEGIKATHTPEEYANILKYIGGEEKLKALVTLNRPQETIIDKKLENGKYIIVYQNPLTPGTPRIETIDLGLPANYTKTIDAGNRILAMPENWDGDPSKLISINKGLTPEQQQKTNNSSNASDYPEYANDPFIQTVLKSKGGKALTDTSIQKLDKGLTVLGQLGVLQTNIQDVKTGPIVGKFKGANPWDTNAQTIKASLNAIVPNLARGVYGEVGVLTDNDIKTYSKTLPNLNSTEAIRNGVLYITLDMIGKAVKNTLSVNAAAGRDVSGFVDIYTGMEDSKNSILSTIPGAQVPKAFSGNVLKSPDGTQEVNLSDLTPAEIKEAKDAGWK